MEQIRKQKRSLDKEQKTVEEVPVEVSQDDHLKDATDDLLDEIDSVLEENASEFVSQYIQSGGQ